MTKCKSLNRLTRKDQVFQWVEVQQRAFEDKEIHSKHTCLNLEKPVTIQTDMSDVGVGAVLSQNGKPVSYVSRVWNYFEKTNPQLEKK